MPDSLRQPDLAQTLHELFEGRGVPVGQDSGVRAAVLAQQMGSPSGPIYGDAPHT